MIPSDLRGLFAFAEVARVGSFSEAALRLGVTKSAVSKLVASAEAALGVQLLVRTTRRVALTEVGEAVFAACVRLGDDLEGARQAAAAHRAVVVGHLRVTAPAVLGRQHLVPLVAAFMAAHPQVSVDLALGDHLVDLVADRIDVALRVRRSFADSSLVVRKLTQVRLRICGAPAYLALRGEPEHPRDLESHTFITHAPNEAQDQLTLRRRGSAVALRMTSRFSCDDGGATAAAAAAGMGLIVAPDFELSDLVAQGQVVPVLEEWDIDRLTLAVLYPEQRHLPAKVRAFVDFVAERWQTPPWLSDDCKKAHHGRRAKVPSRTDTR